MRLDHHPWRLNFVRKQNVCVISGAVQHMDDDHPSGLSAVKNEVVAVDAPSHAMRLVRWHQRKRQRRITKAQARFAEFTHVGERSLGILSGNEVADALDVSLGLGCEMNNHPTLPA